MQLIEFPEQTTIFAKDQPQYLPLPAHVYENDAEGKIAFCWRLTLKERLLLLLTGKLWHHVLTFNQPLQPQMLSLAKPRMKSKYPFPAWTCFRVCVTWCIQAQGAPLIDPTTVNEFTGRTFYGYAIVLRFWRLRWGQRGHRRLWFKTPEPMAALVIGWEKHPKKATA